MGKTLRFKAITADGDKRVQITPRSRMHVWNTVARWEAEHGIDNLVVNGRVYSCTASNRTLVDLICRMGGV